MITASGTANRQTGMSSMLVPTNTTSVAVKRTGPEDGTAFIDEHGRRFDGRLGLSLNIDRTWNVFLSAKYDEEDWIGSNRSGREKGDNKCSERCHEGD